MGKCPSTLETGRSGQGKQQQGLMMPRLVNERLTYPEHAPRSQTLAAEQVALWLRSGIQLWNKRGRRLHPSPKKACSSARRHLYSRFRSPAGKEYRPSGSRSAFCKPRSCATQSCRVDRLLRLCYYKRQSVSILESQGLHSVSFKS